MVRPKKEIPIHDTRIKGLTTLIAEGKTQEEMAAYYRKNGFVDVNRSTISRRLKEMKD